MSLPADPRRKVAANPSANPDAAAGDELHASADEVILATAGYDHTIKFWQAHTGCCVRTLQHADSHVNALDISPDGQVLAAAGYQHIRMFDVNSNNASPVVNYEGVSKNVMAVGFQEEGRWMFTGGEDGTAKIWDLRMHNLQCQKVFNANSPVNSVALHPNQHELIIGDQNGNVHLWNLRAVTSESHVPEPGASIQCVAIDQQALYVAAITNKGTCHVSSPVDSISDASADPINTEAPPANEASTTKLVPKEELSAHKRYGLKCRFSPDSSILATSSADQTCRLWRTSDFSLISELTAENQRWVWDVAFSADSQYLFTASSDNLARLWAIPTEANDYAKEVKRIYKENGHQKAVTCLAFRDGAGGG